MAQNYNGVDAAAVAAIANEPEEVLLPKITSALDLIYNPQSTDRKSVV